MKSNIKVRYHDPIKQVTLKCGEEKYSALDYDFQLNFEVGSVTAVVKLYNLIGLEDIDFNNCFYIHAFRKIFGWPSENIIFKNCYCSIIETQQSTISVEFKTGEMSYSDQI